MKQLPFAALAALLACAPAFAPAATAAMPPGQCQCNLSVISGTTGITMTGGAVCGPCGKPMSAGKVVAAQSQALHAAAAPASNLLSSPFVDAAAVSTTDVAIHSNFFDQQTVNIKAGDTVRWTLVDGFHTVTSDDGLFDSGTLGGGDFSVTFTTPGTYGYHCVFHGGAGSGMFGTVNVAAAPEPFAAALFVPTALLALRRRRLPAH